jgi:hypothetical protein
VSAPTPVAIALTRKMLAATATMLRIFMRCASGDSTSAACEMPRGGDRQ